jgi:RND family efflux transporter MFP subunit
MSRRLPNVLWKWMVAALVCAPLLMIACEQGAERTGEAQAEEPETSSVTRWTNKTELFAEYPPLIVGHTSRFAIHLTRLDLDTFKALTKGRVEVLLRGDGGAVERFVVGAPSRPGIFGVDVKPSHAGVRELVIVLTGGNSSASGGSGRSGGPSDLTDEHSVGAVTVYAASADAAAARAASGERGEESPGISFLKEQQWALDFATAIVRDEAVRESIRVPASLDARPGGAADVTAPIDGRLTRVADLPLGAAVSRGQELARLLPPPAAPADLPQLRRARSEAASALALATRDRERAERLTTAGAAPQKRLDEARAVEDQARARLTAAEGSLAQFDATRTGGAADAEDLFIVRAPITGVIAERAAATGTNVTAGATLFRIADAVRVQVVGHVPEAEAVRARRARRAEIEVAGEDLRLPAGSLIGVGKVIDPATRTLPITFAFDNRAAALPIGQSLFLHLLFDGESSARPSVPADAVVDDGGRPIVFVQREGETFERRAVTLGPRAGNTVQIVDGAKSGERVVTKGAYLVRLASLSTTTPAHGHVH